MNPQPDAAPGGGVTSSDLARAARLLAVRSWREATGLFAGNYASAFRGGGLEFEESRPYAPGDDVRSIDWVATARTGETTVKRFREERNQTLLFALDTSASMQFGSAGPTKAAAAAHALALLAAAAGRAGDRTALYAFDDGAGEIVPIGRGQAHCWCLIRAAFAAAGRTNAGTRVAGVARALAARNRRRTAAVLFSDFRDPDLLNAASTSRLALSGLSRHAEVVACILYDPLEEAIPNVGAVRIADPERPQATLVLDTGRRRNRERYRAAWAARRRRLDEVLRQTGAEPVWLRCDQSPLHTLGRFFRERAARRSRMTSTRRRSAALFAIAAILTTACDRPPGAAATRPRPPVASASVEPGGLGIGAAAVAWLRIEVPPGHLIADITEPPSVAGFEIVRRETLPSQSEPTHEIHRVAVHLRALRVGAWEWPATTIALTDPDGRTATLRTAAVPVEVRSVLGDYPGRTAPFGARAAPPVPPAAPIDPFAGALIAIALASAIGLAVRRHRRHSGAEQPAPTKPLPAWTRAREEFAQARAAVATDAALAADTVAAALRSYMTGRFGAAARAATTEELAAATPPFIATSRWPDFVALMRELDGQRFPRADRAASERRCAAVEELLGRAEAFVEESLPPERLR